MKKVIALFLAACTLFCLTCCGSSPAKSTEKVESKVEKSYSGSELFDATPPEASYPLTTGGETLTVSVEAMASPDGEEAAFTNYALDRSEEITGVNIEVVLTSSAGGGMEAMLDAASGEYPDLIWQPASYLLEDEGEDVLILNDYLTDYAPNYLAALSKDEDAKKAVLSDTGCALRFYTLRQEAGSRISYGPVIRKDMLDMVGMDIPQTYDALHDALSAIKSTFSPALTLRLYPTGSTTADWLCSGYGVSVGSSAPNFGFYVVDGVVKYGPFEDGFESYVTLLNTWYNEGIINDSMLDVLDIDSNSYLMDMAIGKSAVFFVGSSGIKSCEAMSELEGFNLAPIPDPVVEAGDMTHLAESRQELVYSPAYAVSASCESPALAVGWLDFWYSEQGQLLMNYGLEGQSYTLDSSGKPQYIEPTLDAGQNSSYTLWNMAGILSDERISMSYREGYDSETYALWSQNKDTSYMLPNNLMMDVTMAEDLTMMLRDVKSAADEGMMKFIVGDKPISELESFRQTLTDMGASRCVEYYQVFYDNYMNR